MNLIDITPYFHSRSGGIRRYLLEKAKFLKDVPSVRHVIIVPGKEEKIYKLWNSKVYELPSLPILKSGGYRFFRSLNRIKEIIKKEKPNVVELGGTYQPIPQLRSREYILSVFYHADVVGDLSLLPLPNRIRSIFIEHTIRRKLFTADIAITPSKRYEDFLKNYGFDKVKTINLGVDTEIFNPSRKDEEFLRSLGIKTDAFKVLYVGRLSPEKNIDLLLELAESMDPLLFHFVIVGDGALRKKVEKAQKRLANLTYLGYISDPFELAKLYATCDVFLSTSFYETYGLSFLEAQACGCPIIALDMDLESQPFKDFLVKELSIKAFKEALFKLYKNQSNSLRKDISKHIRENFSWEKTFKSLLETYAELTSFHLDIYYPSPQRAEFFTFQPHSRSNR